MPFQDRSTLTYPATNSFPVRKFTADRAPLTTDFRNFKLFDLWLDTVTDKIYMMVDKTATSGTWSLIATGATDLETLTGDTGGAVSPDAAHTINLIGGGATTVAGDPGTNTLTINTPGGGFIWNDETTTGPTSLAAHSGYQANNAGLVTFVLPATAVFGDTFIVTGFGAGGWTITQNAGQTIHFLSQDTTTGVGGSLASNNRYDSVTILCSVANTNFTVIEANGNITVT